MREPTDKQSEIEAVRERFWRCCRPAKQSKNYHDPERLARWREGRQNEPLGVPCAEIARTEWMNLSSRRQKPNSN
jgi:hypothetical protein